MGWLIAYDISDIKRWRRVYHRVRADAWSLQYSLFHAEMKDGEARTIVADLARMIDPKTDDVRAYRLLSQLQPRLGGRTISPEGVMTGVALDLRKPKALIF
jgi:CRISPR-associated protein Cas2